MGELRDVSGRTDGYMFCTAGRLEEGEKSPFPVERDPETERKMGRNIFQGAPLIGNGSMTDELKAEGKNSDRR